jgi:hypothetical protein
MHKVERAKVHLDVLSECVRLWSESQRNSFSSGDDLECKEYVVEIRPPEPDMRAAMIAGDFVSCLRSSLDHLAWQLAATVTPIPSKRICFPIYGENTIDNQVSFTKSTFGLPEEAIAVIRSVQPYHRGDTYKLHYLWILHTLWNIDKHRHIPLHSMITEFSFASGTPQPLRVDKLDDHAKIYFRLGDKPNVKLNPLPESTIVFGDKHEGVTVTAENLRKIYDAVSDQIIPAFARFFV